MKRLIFQLVIIICMLGISQPASSNSHTSQGLNSIVKFKKNKRSTLAQYNKVLKKYSKVLCTPDTESLFWKYMGQFSGNGFYVPSKINKKLDLVTVNRFIPELERKRKWIQHLKIEISKNKKFEKEIKEVKDFQDVIKQLLEYKRQFFESDSSVGKERARMRSKYLFINFRNNFKLLLKKIPFLLSYRHPIDHFDLRLTYDKNKKRDTIAKNIKANEVYFYRKIVQDGAHNPNLSGSDTFLRAAIDTTALEMNKERDLLSENLRYDLNFVLEALLFHLEKGGQALERRIDEWAGRTSRMIEYYKSLKQDKIKIGGTIVNAVELLKKKDEARLNLKKYSLKKQAETYNFWKHQPEELRALFVLDTILYNEVGGLDGRDALERRDVAQVVINRLNLEAYNSIPITDSLFPYLSKKNQTIKTNPWLNVLFKEGEFSFTYYFIGGNVRIFCPVMTKHGIFIRANNLKMAYDLLRKPNYNFKAVRYFSRHSMLGRIDMAKIWSRFEPLAERPGLRARNNNSLKKLYKSGNYEYLYHFTDNKGHKFKVLTFDGKVYVKADHKLEFFKYRNPHFFRYFRKR